MTLHRIACRYSAATTAVIRAPIAILLFPWICAGVIAGGWLAGQLQLVLLVLTTILSIAAFSQSQMVMLKQGQDAGEVDGG